METKHRILFVNEFHRLSSGYGTCGEAILSRLHKSGKYILNELAMYADPEDPNVQNSPWKVYPVLPAGFNRRQCDPKQLAEFQSHPMNEFGMSAFEGAALGCQATIVMSICDWWYFEYQERSPFRRFYKWVIQPTCDAVPQAPHWISTYKNADKVLTYTDWATKTLQEEGGGLIPLVGSASPGVDLNTFRPILDKKAHKKVFGFDPNSLIIGFQSRNQTRKLIPDLINAFASFVEKAPKDLSDRALLYLGTTHPDIGYDIPRLIKKCGVANKIFFPYLCQQCRLVLPQTFKDSVTICPNCNAGMITPNTHMSLSREQLSHMYNLFDVYVQYANSEGLGCGGPEAAACGAPYFGVDYSGMHDVVEKLSGTPIKVLKFITERDTGCLRAVPDDDDLVQKLIKFLSLPESLRTKKGRETRQAAVEYYDWDKVVDKWMNVFDSIPVPDQNPWRSAPHIITPPQSCPDNLRNDQFVSWAIINILGRPDLLNSHFAMRLLRDLECGATNCRPGEYMENSVNNRSYRPFDRNEIVQELMKAVDKNNKWESLRYQLVQQGRIS